MKKHALILVSENSEKFLGSYTFEWMARLAAKKFRRTNPEGEIDIVTMELDAEALYASVMAYAAVTQVLATLLSRDADGNWTTIHDADTRMPEWYLGAIDKALAQ
jgi:hypothetical protein